ncbi:tRNA (adenosine(37)-N6)-threonylcarbamoyltransferase complex ATPase subunit type 1 TsaE [Actinokineospora sp. NPDC004072]
MVDLPTHEDTLAFGRRLGALLQPGDLVLLSGPLGAGKTVLAKGIGEGLGVKGRISSPTFIIAREHPAGPRGIPMIHVDAYRLNGDLAQLDDLDLDTELVEAAVIIEWGEGAAERLSTDHLLIHLTRHPDDTRAATLHPSGTWTTRITALLETPNHA